MQINIKMWNEFRYDKSNAKVMNACFESAKIGKAVEIVQ
jgi:hypothetical protein